MGQFATRTSISLLFTASALMFAIVPMFSQQSFTTPSTSRVPAPANLQPRIDAHMVPFTGAEEATIVGQSTVLRNGSYPKYLDQVQATLPGAKVGFTYYDFQTNAAMANRIAYYEDGSDKYLQVLWMASPDPTRDPATRIPGFNSARGSYYNYLDVNDADNPVIGIETWGKMESDRAGWPSIGMFDDGSIGTASHVPIKFFRNTGIGDGQFFEFAQVTTAADSALWPRIAVDGENNIHMVYNRTPPGGRSQVAYRRSIDGGTTWGAELHFTGAEATKPESVTGTLPNGAGGDTYAIAARGANVVVMYGDSPLRVLARRSTDYGATWTDDQVGIRLIYDANHTFIDSVNFGLDSIRVFSDTVLAPSMHMDVILDSKGVAHYAIGQALTYIIQTGLVDNSAPGSRFGTIYSVDDDALYRGLGVFYYRDGDTLIYTVGAMGDGFWDGNGAIVSRRDYSGVARYPQLGLSAQDDLYMVYTSVKTGDTKAMQIDTTRRFSQSEPDTLVDVNGLYGHIYGIYRMNNSLNWSPPTSLTPDGVNCLFGTLADNVANGRMYVGYSASATPGDRVTNVETPADVADVYVMAFKTSDLGVVNSIDEETSELQASVTIAPNPANEQTEVQINSVTPGEFTVSVISSVGQVISQTKSPSTSGNWNISIPTSSLATGAYFVVVEQNGVRTIRTINVLH